MTELLAALGLLSVVTLVALVALGVYLSRLRAQVRHCLQITATVLRAYEAETGARLPVDHALLDEPLDAIAEDGSDVYSRVPDAAPWGVL